MPYISLYDIISKDLDLPEETQEAILSLVCEGCRADTWNHCRRILSHIHTVPAYGIFQRLRVIPNVEYIAGQSYPDELRTIREILKKGR